MTADWGKDKPQVTMVTFCFHGDVSELTFDPTDRVGVYGHVCYHCVFP